MNKVFTLLAASALLVSMSACEECSTCTSVSDEPFTEGDIITEEVCGVGRDYDDQIEIYTRSGWECGENAE